MLFTKEKKLILFFFYYIVIIQLFISYSNLKILTDLKITEYQIIDQKKEMVSLVFIIDFHKVLSHMRVWYP